MQYHNYALSMLIRQVVLDIVSTLLDERNAPAFEAVTEVPATCNFNNTNNFHGYTIIIVFIINGWIITHFLSGGCVKTRAYSSFHSSHPATREYRKSGKCYHFLSDRC